MDEPIPCWFPPIDGQDQASFIGPMLPMLPALQPLGPPGPIGPEIMTPWPDPIEIVPLSDSPEPAAPLVMNDQDAG